MEKGVKIDGDWPKIESLEFNNVSCLIEKDGECYLDPQTLCNSNL